MPSDYLARGWVEVGGQAGPFFPRGDADDVAAPHAVPLSDGEFPVQDIGPFVRGLSAPSVLPRAPAGCQPLPRHHATRGLAVRDDADLAKLDDDPPRSVSAIVGAEDVPRRTAPAPRGLFASMIWGGSGRHGIRPCWRPASRMPSWRPSNVRRPSRTRAPRLGLPQEAPDFFQYRGLLAELPFSFLSFGIS